MTGNFERRVFLTIMLHVWNNLDARSKLFYWVTEKAFSSTPNSGWLPFNRVYMFSWFWGLNFFIYYAQRDLSMDFMIPSLQPQLLQRNIISGNGIAISCGTVANKQKIFGIWDRAALAQVQIFIYANANANANANAHKIFDIWDRQIWHRVGQLTSTHQPITTNLQPG